MDEYVWHLRQIEKEAKDYLNDMIWSLTPYPKLYVSVDAELELLSYIRFLIRERYLEMRIKKTLKKMNTEQD